MLGRAARALSRAISSATAQKGESHTVLGVTEEASEQEIKAAYFSMARKYHPDVNSSPSATVKFKEINEYKSLRAYERLTSNSSSDSDSEPTNTSKPQSPEDWDWTEFEEYIFSGFSRMPKRGRDIHATVVLTLLESVKAGVRPVTITRKVVCEVCGGRRTLGKSQLQRCNTCRGTGRLRFNRGFVGCLKCHGTGIIVSHPCPACAGEGLATVASTEPVHFPAGIAEGFKLRIKNKGHQSALGGAPGDLVITVKLKSDPDFRRSGVDVISKVSISLAEAVLGTTVRVDTIHGKENVVILPGISHGARIKLAGQGLRRGSAVGDHCLVVTLAVPKVLSQEQRELYERLAAIEKRK